MRIYIDTETTGFSPRDGATIVEIGAVAYDDDWKEVASLSRVVNPGEAALQYRHADKALKVNGITREEIKGGANPEDAARALHKLASLGTRLHAFNVQFDSRFLEEEPWRMPMVRWSECVMLEAMNIMGPAGALPVLGGYGDRKKYKWPKLSEAVEYFNIKIEGDAHRALTDARMAAAVHRKILALKQGGTDAQDTSGEKAQTQAGS